MERSKGSNNPFLGKGVYTIYEAGRLTGAKRETLRRWLTGYTRKTGGDFREYPPIFESDFGYVDDEFVISFLDLIELLFVTRFRQHKVKWPIIREAFELAKTRFESGHPFSSLQFKTDGKYIFEKVISEAGEQITEIHNKQFVFSSIIEPTLYRALEFDGGEAKVWYPKYPSKVIVIDPARSFGRPIVASTGVPTYALFEAYRADEDWALVAADFDTPVQQVRSAVQFEYDLAA